MKTLLKILVGLVLLLLVAGLYLTFSHQPQSFPSGSESARRLAPGPWTVSKLSETFVDRERPTQANEEFPGAAQRTLEGAVWYPFEAEAGPRPLLVFSHGFTSGYRNGAYLAEHLASHGFVVVAVDYPLTSFSAPGGPMLEDVINQPGDISFLIDTLLGLSAVSGHALSGKIDAARIGVTGISLGGLTSTLAVFHPALRDSRVRAALSIAGPTYFFTPEFFAGARVPFMMLAGELDALVPYDANAAPVLLKVPDAELLTISGGSHTGFSGGAAWLRVMRNTDALGCFSVLRNIDEGDEDQWAGLFGPPSLGIDYSQENQLCQVDPLPVAMNVLRQQMIAKVIVTAFFEEHLASRRDVRRAAAAFLAQQVGSEVPEVIYRRGASLNDVAARRN